MTVKPYRITGICALLAGVLLPGLMVGQAIIGTVSGSNQAIVFPSPGTGLPTPTQFDVAGVSNPQGVSYYGSDNALVTNFEGGQVYVVKISTHTLVDTINTGSAGYDGGGTIAVAPGLNFALASGDTSAVEVIAAPFTASSTITSVALPGAIPAYQTEAIVFNAAGRAFVYNTGGISVLDPPYSSVAFTIPVTAVDGAIAISPDGNTLLTTALNSTVSIYSAPFSSSSTAVSLTVGSVLDGIVAVPDGSATLVVSAGDSTQFWAINPPYSASSTVQAIPLGSTYGAAGFEDIGVSADSQLAILTGNDTGATPDTPFVQAPFTTVGATVSDVMITGGRGAGSARFLPPGLAPGLTISKAAPANINSGQNLTYTITYGNTGGANASNVVITDPVPTGTTFFSATGGGTFASGSVTWNIGTVNSGVTGQTVSFTVTVNATSGTVSNTNYTIAGTGISAIPGPPVFTTIGGGGPTPTPTPGGGPTPTPVAGPGVPVPTLAMPMKALLGLALALIAFLVIRRQG